MGDTTEAIRETDVSSTTADVPEAEEVSGSNGDVETILVVEQVDEVELASNNNQSVEGLTTELSTSDSSPKKDQTPQVDISPSKSGLAQRASTPIPINNPPTESVPIKTPPEDSELLLEKIEKPTLISPAKLDLIVSTQQENKREDVLEVQQSETVDSSCNVEAQSSCDEIVSNETDDTTVKIDIERNSPEKNISTKKSDTKEVDSEDATGASKSNTDQEKLNDIDKVDSTDSSKHESIVDKNSCKTPISMEINSEIEASNDSQIETNSDMSEKERKSISRELKSLIKSAKESKIINECTQLTTKMRKSRSALDSSNTSFNTSMEPDKIEGQRRASCSSQKSNSSEKSEKVLKRSMRSQNPEFVNKVKQFLNSVTGKAHKNETETGSQLDDVLAMKQKDNQNTTSPSSPKKKMLKPSEDLVPDKAKGKLTSDAYCWRCHWGVDQDSADKTHLPMYCTVCPRSFHYKCFTGPERNKLGTENVEKNWVCPECRAILQAESSESRSPAMKKLSLGTLCELLNYALERMMDINGVEPFTHPVDRATFPQYDKYVIHPMDLSIIKENIKKGLYGSTEAFHADTQWILHNSIIFNTMQSKLTGVARTLLRSCRAEMGEIEACPECYLAAHSRKPTWFIEVCSSPHILLWAKLKGFPYWPAKGMSVNNSGLVDVRFFGAHDRAWVPAKDCFLYSEKDPNNFRSKRQDIIDSMQEAEQHIRNISRKYGKFVYPPFRTPFEINKMTEQIKLMIPSFEGEANCVVKNKSYTASPNTSKIKGSKSSLNEGDASDAEDVTTSSGKAESVKQAPKMQDFAVEQVPMEVDKAAPRKPFEMTTRKRRRSELEEAVITILESGPKDKRPKLDTPDKQIETKKAEIKKTEKVAEPTKTSSNSPQVEKQKSKENERATPKSKSKDTPSGKNKTPTFVSKTPKINPFKIVLTPKSKTPKTPKSTDKSAKKSDDHNKSQSTTPRSLKRKAKPLEVKLRQLTTPDKSETPVKKNIHIVPVKVTSKPTAQKETDTNNKSLLRQQPGKSSPVQKPTKDRIQFDDDISLAVLARETSKTKSQNILTNHTGLPTISCVRSLSDTSANSSKTNKNQSKSALSEANSPKVPSNDNNKNSKDASNNSQKQDESSLVGKVGVRSFARMTSPSVEVPITNNVQVEIKSEPIDLDDADRQVEKMDLMNAFRLRPVNQVTPPVSSLRDVRINKIVITPPNARKSTSKPPEGGRHKAKKSFPPPKKDDGRSELNSKNSMVYIPIQPPTSQAPVRPQRPVQNGPVTCTTTVRTSNTASTGNNLVNTVTTPLISNSIGIPMTSSNIVQNMPPALIAANPSLGQVSGNMPLTTMPMLATMNGQWTLMPIMSVGGVDNAASPTLVNGIPDRSAPAQSIMPISNLTLTANTTSLNTNVITSSQVQRPTETGPGELPRLQQRPIGNPLDANNPPEEVPTPPTAGPATKKLCQNSMKLADFFRHLLEDSLKKVDDPSAMLTSKTLQLESAIWKHKQEVDELIHGHNLMLTEMRLSFEKEKTRAVNEAKKSFQLELEKAVRQTKQKQWCASCYQEAQFYCCWNTSYCNYNCQRKHWPIHFTTCTQQKNKNKNGQEMSSEPELQPQPDNLPKSTKVPSAPTLTVGGKVITPEKNPKPAIIMSMVQDSSGTTSIKCLGTYKEPTYGNKQVIRR